jgi:hydroxymethylbilane synthase
VPTRIRKCLGENALDAILLATAGVLRLDLLKLATSTIEIDGQTLHAEVLDPVKFMPAAGQGAIAIEVRSDDAESRACVRALNHDTTEARVIAEREFLRLLGAGCQTPVGAHTTIENSNLHMSVRVFSESDLQAAPQELQAAVPVDQPLELAKQLANKVTKSSVVGH